MPKNKIRTITAIAMLTAFSIIFERFIPIISTDTLRISLGDVPVFFASILLGPIAGVLCGVIADVIGCFLNGYPPFPFLMLAPVIVGLFPGLFALVAKKKFGKNIYGIIALSITVTVTNIFASLIVTSIGLNMMFGTPLSPLLIQRLPATLINTAIDITVLYLLLKNSVITSLFKE